MNCPACGAAMGTPIATTSTHGIYWCDLCAATQSVAKPEPADEGGRPVQNLTCSTDYSPTPSNQSSVLCGLWYEGEAALCTFGPLKSDASWWRPATPLPGSPRVQKELPAERPKAVEMIWLEAEAISGRRVTQRIKRELSKPGLSEKDRKRLSALAVIAGDATSSNRALAERAGVSDKTIQVYREVLKQEYQLFIYRNVRADKRGRLHDSALDGRGFGSNKPNSETYSEPRAYNGGRDVADRAGGFAVGPTLISLESTSTDCDPLHQPFDESKGKKAA